MFKLSKESRNTFFALLPIPVIWMAINHFGYLDYLKTKTVDWRMVYRGEIPQNSTIDAADMVKVEGNYSVPRIPKVTYVNFDAETLSMDGVGERPWDRAFFRDTAMTLLEKGKARSIGFDFGFTPKSMSSMVPKENSYRSDLAMGDLVASFPDKVVLGCLYSGVPTPFVKSIEASAFPPCLWMDTRKHRESLVIQKPLPILCKVLATVTILEGWVLLPFHLFGLLMKYQDGFHCGFLRGAKLMRTMYLAGSEVY